jgi:hypothetical protein
MAQRTTVSGEGSGTEQDSTEHILSSAFTADVSNVHLLPYNQVGTKGSLPMAKALRQ